MLPFANQFFQEGQYRDGVRCANSAILLGSSSKKAQRLFGTSVARNSVVKPHYQLQERALAFGADALPLCEPLLRRGPLYRHIGEQLFRAASSIGAHIEEGQVAASRRDMAARYAIGLREARESLHWLRVLERSHASTPQVALMAQEANAIVAMLTASVKKLRNPEEEQS